MRDVLQLEKELVARKKILKERIIDMSGGDRMEYGIQVTCRTKKGPVDYKAVLEAWDIDETAAATHRKADIEYVEVKSY